MKKIVFLMIGLLFFQIASAKVKIPSHVNINHADIAALMTLKGVGPKKARAIILDRKRSGDFHSVNELTRIKGITVVFLKRLLQRNPGRISVND